MTKQQHSIAIKQHPMTPPADLFKQWECMPRNLAFEAAYRAGADQELEACCEWLEKGPYRYSVAALASDLIGSLRAARRPKPPTLAEEALEQLNGIETVFKATYGGDLVDNYIRLALERLQELEAGR